MGVALLKEKAVFHQGNPWGQISQGTFNRAEGKANPRGRCGAELSVWSLPTHSLLLDTGALASSATTISLSPLPEPHASPSLFLMGEGGQR